MVELFCRYWDLMKGAFAERYNETNDGSTLLIFQV